MVHTVGVGSHRSMGWASAHSFGRSASAPPLRNRGSWPPSCVWVLSLSWRLESFSPIPITGRGCSGVQSLDFPCEFYSVASWATTIHPLFLLSERRCWLLDTPTQGAEAYPQGSWASDRGQGKAYSGSRYQGIMGCLLPLPQLSPKAASGLFLYLQ